MSKSKQVILGIELAIGGGSLAVVMDGSTIALRHGQTDKSKAEDVLPNLLSMLTETGISPRELTGIAVSIGPGSYTGLRIGISTAMGLRDSLGIPCVGVSALNAIAAASSKAGPLLVAVPFGKNDVAWQEFDGSEPIGGACSGTLDDLYGLMRTNIDAAVLVHSDVLMRFQGHAGMREVGERVIDNGADTAVALALAFDLGSMDLRAIYLQNPRYQTVTARNL